MLIGPKKYQEDGYDNNYNSQSARQHPIPLGSYRLFSWVTMNSQRRFHFQTRWDRMNNTFPLCVKPEGKPLYIHRTCRDLTPDRIQRSKADNPGYKGS